LTIILAAASLDFIAIAPSFAIAPFLGLRLDLYLTLSYRKQKPCPAIKLYLSKNSARYKLGKTIFKKKLKKCHSSYKKCQSLEVPLLRWSLSLQKQGR
jgi:hypothetical protein